MAESVPAALADLEAEWQQCVNKSRTSPQPPDWGVMETWGDRERLKSHSDIWMAVPLDDTQKFEGHYPGLHERDRVSFIWAEDRMVADAVTPTVLDQVQADNGQWVRVVREHGETVGQAFARFLDDPPEWMAWVRETEYFDDPGLSPSMVMSGHVLEGPADIRHPPRSESDPDCLFGLFSTTDYPKRSMPGVLVIHAA